MIHSLFILNNVGDIIIEKHYKGLINRTVCEAFWSEVSRASSFEEVNPILPVPKFYVVHIQQNGLFYLALISKESPPLLAIEFLHRLTETLVLYFNERVTEISLRENFVTVYQLLDEMMDNGFPFTTEPNSLMEIIPPSNVFKKVVGGITGQSTMSGALPDGSLSNTPWRKTGVKYTTNEVYVDIIEEIDTTVEANGLTTSCEVAGEVHVQSKLSGMPDMSLFFANPHILDDVSFHPCVRYNRYEQNKSVSFIPPDGHFKLMSYRVKDQLQLPIYVKPQISFSATGGRVSVMVGTKSTGGKPVEDVVVTIPFPKAVSTTSLAPNVGYIQYDDITKMCKWYIGKIPKDKTPLLEGNVTLGNGAAAPESNPVLQAEFKIVQFAASGLRVDSLTLHNERYKTYKGVKCITKAGKFHVRS